MAIATNASEAPAEDHRPLGYLERQCPVRASLDVIRGRWKPCILQELHRAPARYADFLETIDGLSPQALTMQLRQLVADGVVARTSALEYRLTDRGNALSTVMEALQAWGDEYLDWRAQENSADRYAK